MSDKPGFLRYISSFFSEKVIERKQSRYSGMLEVWYVFGKYVLNAPNVNYSFGQLHDIYKAALKEVDPVRRGMKDVLVLGLGAGSIPQILNEMGDGFRITGVELDEAVIELGKKYFGLHAQPGLEIVQQDAADFVSTAEGQWDLICVDLFIDRHIPDFAREDHFIRKLNNMLNPGGVLLYNCLEINEELKAESADFFQKLKQLLPGIRKFNVKRNAVYIYEKAN